MTEVIVMGHGADAWTTALAAARQGVPVRFLVTPGPPDFVGPVFDPALADVGFPLPRRVRLGATTLDLPLDPIDVIAAIGPAAWARDVLSLARASTRRARSVTLADLAERALGRRMAARWSVPWLAARLGDVTRPAADLDGRRPIGWFRRADVEGAVRDAVWRAGGDVLDDVRVEGFETTERDGRPFVEVLVTGHGIEHVDGDVFVEREAPRVVRTDALDRDGVTEHAEPASGVWRTVTHDGSSFAYGPPIAGVPAPAAANVHRLGGRGGPLDPRDPYPG